MRYQILCMSGRVPLEDLVESEILYGWIPQGGISTTQEGPKKLWMQAMIHPSLEIDELDVENINRRLKEHSLRY